MAALWIFVKSFSPRVSIPLLLVALIVVLVWLSQGMACSLHHELAVVPLRCFQQAVLILHGPRMIYNGDLQRGLCIVPGVDRRQGMLEV
ncbi:hypothetical protein Bca4012_027567 [Brassica carinata]